MKRMSFRGHVVFLILLIMNPLLQACSTTRSALPPERASLRVCYSALTATQIPLLYAQDQGFFEAQNLDLELFYFNSGTDAVTSLIAGETDLCQVAGSSVVNAAAAGEDLVFLAGLFNTYVYSVIVSAEITKPEDLRGKTVAISKIGSSSDAAIRIALKGMGLVPDEDVTILGIGDQNARLAAIQSGQIAGTVISIPESTRAQQLGFRELLDMSTLNAPFQHTAIVTTRQFLDSNREQVVRFMSAMIAAIRQIRTDRESTIEVMAKYLDLDPLVDQELLSAAYDDLIPPYLPAIPYPTVPGIQVLIDELESSNPNASELVAADLVDSSLVDEALQALNGGQDQQ